MLSLKWLDTSQRIYWIDWSLFLNFHGFNVLERNHVARLECGYGTICSILSCNVVLHKVLRIWDYVFIFLSRMTFKNLKKNYQKINFWKMHGIFCVKKEWSVVDFDKQTATPQIVHWSKLTFSSFSLFSIKLS